MAQLLQGNNINFGSPLVTLMEMLKSGSCSPKAAKYQDALRVLQKIDYYNGLRKYHNDKVTLLHEMQSLWFENPEANHAERMELWHSHMSASGAPVSHIKARYVPTNGRSSLKLTFKKGKSLGAERKLAQVIMEAQPITHGEPRPSSQEYSGLGDSITHGESKKSLSLSRRSRDLDIQLGNHNGIDFKRRKVVSKGFEKQRSLSGTKPNNNDLKANFEKSHILQRRLSDSRVERNNAFRKHREVGYRDKLEYIDPAWQDFSQPTAQDDVGSSSDQEDIMDELLSDEEPLSRKNFRSTRDIKREDMNSSDSSALVRAKSLYRSPEILSSPGAATDFPFSVLRFLSAVRGSLLDSVQQHVLQPQPFHEILRRVQDNPGDVRVFSVSGSLEGLLRGALEVLSSKTIPHMMQGWKPLVAHERFAKGWCWIGPVPTIAFLIDSNGVETDAETWGIPQKMVVRIQDAFISWFHGAQEMLQLLAHLDVPPLPDRPFVSNEEDRFQGLRAQRSLVTISPTTDEMRAYFQQEEAIRYSLQDTVFFYTTACGEKSAVAPLRRLGGKPNSKARDHLVLKSDRPSHVTILYLVRDAAARLPRSLGTRADVAVLLRDSQFIVEDASFSQLSHVVSGALDRLRYERDPCVQFDADRKLWVYLHADREEDDFEGDGTSSTKRSKRGKKDVADGFDISGHDQYFAGDESRDRFPSEADCNSSPASCAGNGDFNYTADTPELFYNHQSNSLASSFPSCLNMQSHLMGWEMYR
ncbi:hypothetical protein KP509_05G054400 [Ceratopteris richardii]|nr:hypothetical protein KP509_05G054400 [Ceratopteris richardii]